MQATSISLWLTQDSWLTTMLFFSLEFSSSGRYITNEFRCIGSHANEDSRDRVRTSWSRYNIFKSAIKWNTCKNALFILYTFKIFITKLNYSHFREEEEEKEKRLLESAFELLKSRKVTDMCVHWQFKLNFRLNSITFHFVSYPNPFAMYHRILFHFFAFSVLFCFFYHVFPMLIFYDRFLTTWFFSQYVNLDCKKSFHKR